MSLYRDVGRKRDSRNQCLKYPQKLRIFVVIILSLYQNSGGGIVMEIIFNEQYLQDLYLTGRTDKKHRYQPHIIRKYIRVINLMIDVQDILELRQYNSLNYEKLKGDKIGLSSVRVNDQYRIEFEERMKDGEAVVTICNITDLSNHYK